MWRVAGRGVVVRCGLQITCRASTPVGVGCLQCPNPQVLTHLHYCGTRLGGVSRSLFGWPGAAEREELLAAKAKLEERLKELEEETREHRVTLTDLQKELQSTRSDQSSTQARLVGLEAQLKTKDVSKSAEVIKALERYAEADESRQNMRSAFQQIRKLMEDSGVYDTRGEFDQPAPEAAATRAAPEAEALSDGSAPPGPQSSRAASESAPSGGAAADAAAGLRKTRVKVGGIEFDGYNHLRQFCSEVVKSAAVGEMIDEETSRVLYNLFRRGHPQASAKLGLSANQTPPPARPSGDLSERYPKFKVDLHPQRNTKCVFVVRSDGSAEEISFHKAIKGLKQRVYSQ
mmetsp:Transcript_17472/g.38052  ORF Transcript_17472/g.38052 Transcript_17472/m.38052 type:complete len:346 (-) Transcript_17472:105-1142(-)